MSSDVQSLMQRAAFELRIDDLKALFGTATDLHGLLLAACSAHNPDAALQRRVIRFLVDAGVDVEERYKNGVTPLHRAARYRSLAAVETLIELDASVNAVDRRTCSTPLHRAVTNTGAPGTAGKMDAAIEIARLLLANGADPTIKNKRGKTPRDYIRNPRMLAVFEKHASG